MPSPGTGESSIRSERVDAARQRLEAGEYDRPEVIETIVARLMTRITHE
jgi:hypothetical protein